MLCSELFESRPLTWLFDDAVTAPRQGEVEVKLPYSDKAVTVCINPSALDTARMLQRIGGRPLRAVGEPGRFVIFPADDAMHQTVQIALRMDDRCRRYFVYGSDRRSERSVSQVGRYWVYAEDAAHQLMQPKFMSAEMRRALGLR